MKPGVKKDPERRWALPDRVIFGNGACHILAGVYLQAPPLPGFYAERTLPGDGFAGNHIYVTDGTVAFDYHGCSLRHLLLRYYTNNWAEEYTQGWHCRLERVAFNLLSTQALNARKMLGPTNICTTRSNGRRDTCTRSTNRQPMTKPCNSPPEIFHKKPKTLS
ncbi:hypothetical protein [Tropicibacter sp. Alg240-R139]|uniref:hypothetical protein n=1 Tax=Tropicibacter sp. Alg240-R139 TaxID=2305991 RepID=UPI001967BCDF|nr:hypothetical protein [Tropicibacter sp. Alg240-R139]